MARTRYGKTFRTRRGRYGRYKYVNGRRVSFVAIKRRSKKKSFRYHPQDSRGDRAARRRWDRRRY